MTNAYLTIDDAPSSHMDEKVDILNEHGITAIFFCEGVKIQKRTEHVKYAIQNGHLIGNHSWSHKRFSSIDLDRGEEEIRKTHRVIDDVYDSLGVERRYNFFRFPYGDKGDRGDSENREFYQDLLSELGYRFPLADRYEREWAGDRDWYWTFNDKTYSLKDVEQVLERIDDNAFEDSPEIVIYHDHENTQEWFEPFVQRITQEVVFEDPNEL